MMDWVSLGWRRETPSTLVLVVVFAAWAVLVRFRG